jgi:hypothetical protein
VEKKRPVSPFSIENVDDEKERQIANCYGALEGLSALILKSQQNGPIIGLSPEVAIDWKVDEQPQHGELVGVRFEARFDRPSAGGGTATTALLKLRSGRWGRSVGNAAWVCDVASASAR